MKYTYTAVITPNDDGTKFYCRVPDLPGCITTGNDLDDAIEQITDAANIWLVGSEDDGEDPVPATPQADIPHDANAILTLLQLDTLQYRAMIDTRAVRKNVSLPAWMATLADKRGINCSQVLQDGLLAKLS